MGRVKLTAIVCDLCGRESEPAREGEVFPGIEYWTRIAIPINERDETTKEICGSCKSALLDEWNARCE